MKTRMGLVVGAGVAALIGAGLLRGEAPAAAGRRGAAEEGQRATGMDEGERRGGPARRRAAPAPAAAVEVTADDVTAEDTIADEEPDEIEEATAEDADPAARARALRLPVILAIRGDHPTPEARHDAMRAALEGSGPSEEPWTTAAPSVFEAWEASISPEIDRRLDPDSVRCFRAGCEVRLRFADPRHYEAAAAALRGLSEREVRHGGRVQTPAITRPDGTVEASWILLRPDLTEG